MLKSTAILIARLTGSHQSNLNVSKSYFIFLQEVSENEKQKKLNALGPSHLLPPPKKPPPGMRKHQDTKALQKLGDMKIYLPYHLKGRKPSDYLCRASSPSEEGTQHHTAHRPEEEGLTGSLLTCRDHPGNTTASSVSYSKPMAPTRQGLAHVLRQDIGLWMKKGFYGQ